GAADHLQLPVHLGLRAVGQLLVLPALRHPDPGVHAEQRLLRGWTAPSGIPVAAGLDAAGLLDVAPARALAPAPPRAGGADRAPLVGTRGAAAAQRLVDLHGAAPRNHDDPDGPGHDGLGPVCAR